MKKVLFAFIIFFTNYHIIFAFGDSYTISEVYVELEIRYDTYYAEIDGGGFSIKPEFGKVKKLYKKGTLSEIGYGKYIVELKWLSNDLFMIAGTPYLLKIQFATQFTFNGLDVWILDTTYGLNGQIIKKE